MRGGCGRLLPLPARDHLGSTPGSRLPFCRNADQLNWRAPASLFARREMATVKLAFRHSPAARLCRSMPLVSRVSVVGNSIGFLSSTCDRVHRNGRSAVKLKVGLPRRSL